MLFENHKVYMNGEYPAIFLNGKSQHVHRLQWIKHHGSIPKGFIVHHKDENKLNWNIDNLELLSRSEHIRKHSDIVHRKGIPIEAIKGDVVIVFPSIEICAEKCNIHTIQVQRILKGKQKQSKGWTFRKVGDYNSIL